MGKLDWECKVCKKTRPEYLNFVTVPEWIRRQHFFPVICRCPRCGKIEVIFGVSNPSHKQCW
jgi:hypothetical protein